METLNIALFKWMSGCYAPEPHLLAVARWVGVYGLAAIPLVLIFLWGRRPRSRETVLTALASGLVALLVTEILVPLVAHPRPFMLGLSPLYVAHSVEGSFPSAHASLMLATGGTLLLTRRTLLWGMVLTACGVATGWARVYLGLHFPLDILGSALLASATVAALGWRAHGWLTCPLGFLEQLGSRMLRKNKPKDNEHSRFRVV